MRIDWSAVLAGARRGVLLAAACVVVGQTVRGLTGTSISLFLYPVLFAGLAYGGREAGRRQPPFALTHGALAALCAYALLMAVITVIRLSLGREDVVDPVLLVSNAFMAASAGILGGYLALVRPGERA